MNKQLLAAAAAATLGIGTAAAIVAPAGASTPTCHASQLQPHYDGQQGAAGTVYDMWHFTNVGSSYI